mgnify:CR=1 FL=1
MILEGNERGYGDDLAQHLQNLRQNDHVSIHAVDGFLAEDLHGAFAEAEAISGATQCSKYLFSLSLNPPIEATPTVADFEDAIGKAERRLGLTGQPRAIVFHEKNGRRHAHAVWSKIDAATMRAINLSHYKRKLCDVSRELFLHHNWEMPAGLRDAAERDPNTFSRPEAQQAKRAERDPKALKAMFRRCWQMSDSRAAFAAALKEEGFLLARGDRRGFVAIDADGKVWSLSRWCGVKPKDLRAQLGSEADLPSIEDVLAEGVVLPRTHKVKVDPVLEQRRTNLVKRQREERRALLKAQEARRSEDLKVRQSRMPKGLKAAFLRVTGRYHAVMREAEALASAARDRDQEEQQALIARHLVERREHSRDLAKAGVRPWFNASTEDGSIQPLLSPPDDLALTKSELLRDPARILAHVSKTKARFTRADVLRELVKRIDDPIALRDSADRAMRSPELIRLSDGPDADYTTQDFRCHEERLRHSVQRMTDANGFGVARSHIETAMRSQNRQMHRAFGGHLSAEQCAALEHILSDRQMASVVGLAGAGKSTMLATAMDAWTRQGITVHGAALAGKAADGLEEASGIASRTLASLEVSWENGYAPIAKGDVLVVDEAGMIGTRQLARIAARIEEIGAKLVLVGDPDQLQPIEAGTPFRSIVTDHGAARLTEIHRQRADWQKQASRILAEGNLAEALAAYSDRNAVIRGQDAIDALVETYVMDVESNGWETSRLAFARRRRDVHALNQAIRTTLRSGKEPEIETLFATETGPRAFGAGDRIVFGRNDRELGVKNGMLGTVERIDGSKITVQLDGDRERCLTFDASQYRHFDHGYAVTIHKSQGATVDHGYVLASRSMDRHLAYVAMTRHRDDLRVFVLDRDRPSWIDQGHTPSMQRSARSRSGPSMG